MPKRGYKKVYTYMGEPDGNSGAGEIVQDEGVLKLLYTFYRENPELSVYECGWEKCHNQHSYGPVKRQYYLVHYITDGKGEYTVNNRLHKLGKGNIFLIPPEVTTFYKADEQEPWTYFWVGFNGIAVKKILKSSGFDSQTLTLKPNNPDKIENIMRSITQYSERSASTEYGMLGCLYLLFSELMKNAENISESKETDNYISKAIKYIAENYSRRISINEVAFHIGLDRSYFFKIFKYSMGISPQEHLINVRMSKAQIMLRDSDMSCHEVAAHVGYDNYNNFSKMFKRKFGMSPKEYAAHPFENNH